VESGAGAALDDLQNLVGGHVTEDLFHAARQRISMRSTEIFSPRPCGTGPGELA